MRAALPVTALGRAGAEHGMHAGGVPAADQAGEAGGVGPAPSTELRRLWPHCPSAARPPSRAPGHVNSCELRVYKPLLGGPACRLPG